MKRKLLSIVLVFMMGVLSACGAAENTKQAPVKEPAASKQPKAEENKGSAAKALKLTLAAGSAGGSSSVIGEAVGETIKRTAPGTSFTYQPSQYGANAPLVGEGKAELGMEGAEQILQAYKGEGIYKKAYPNLRSIAFLHDNSWHFFLSKDTGITTMEQIAEKKAPLKISVNTKNGLIEVPNRWVFEEYGFSYEAIEKWGGTINFGSSKQADPLYKDRQINGFARTTQQPLSTNHDVLKAVPANFIHLSPEVIGNILKKHPSTRPSVIKAGTYEGLDKDYKTFSTPMYLIATKDMPDDAVYTITKALHEQLKYLHSASAVLTDMSPETLKLTPGIPLHPGAEKYYKEVGIIK